jgi:hypothetical protein
MSRRIYEELQQIIEQAGGEMLYERAGAPGGKWTVTLRGHVREFLSNGAGFPELDRLYVPKGPEPAHYSDYTKQLVPDAANQLMKLLVVPAPVGPSTGATATGLASSCGSVDDAALPFPDAQDYLERVKASRDLPERNMEDLVKELFIRLGHSPSSIVFQVGHIDVSVRGRDGAPFLVAEVKRSLRSKPERDSALRQAFDYANKTGAPLVVITDADFYEIYDRRSGLDHVSMLKAKFQLTQLQQFDLTGFELLRPS